jgi:predicted dehydrogenase
MQAFVDAVRAGRPMPVTGADGRRATALALAATRSARENRYVSLES